MKSIWKAVFIIFLSVTVSTQFVACGGSEPVQEEPETPVDSDGDGIIDDEELQLGTDPNNPDTDTDGLSDGDEVNVYKTDPLNADTDGDTLTDGEEVLSHGTDPLKVDTDGDGLSDADEINVHKTNPLRADTDGDGISDADELAAGTDPLNPDSDGDGFTDGQELEMGTNSTSSNDPVYISELGTVNFAFDRSNLDDEAARALASNVELLQSNTKFTVQINAYTDHIGGDQYNLRLSRRRANSVLDFYKRNGIDESRIEARGLGKAPVRCAQEDQGSRGCRKNRRAESVPVSPYQFRPNQ